ncbi:MAG TPA: DUF3891 family protein [Thermoanaerobaculia bacterium]|nr:DUF3891 family protein [Thermoanaerobaculia bacterium]
MIVVTEQDTWRFITQPDHAAFAAELLSLWRAEGVPEHPRRAALLFAVREHDNGWREADAAPRWDPERRRPHDFLTMPRPARIEVWERGVSRFAGEHPSAALLITRHARRLHRDRRGAERWQELLETLDELERGLAEATGATEEEIAADDRLLDRSDTLSLAACSAWTDPFELHGVRARLHEGSLRLDPFPLAGATTFRIPCRRIAARDYGGDAALGGEFAAARWGELMVRVAPFAP